MKHSVFEERLIKQIKEKLPQAAPGVMVQVYQNGRKVCDVAVGDTFAYYDLASLTKVIFTTQALMKAFSEGRWNIKTTVEDILPWFPHRTMLLMQLMNHTSGLTWWVPFYKDLDMNQSIDDRWLKLQAMITAMKLEKHDHAVYSDVGFLLLGMALVSIYQKPLFDIWSDMKEQFYPRLSLEFHPQNQPKYPARYYAPTEKCPWRGRVMQGEVHDENAWALGGISSHAGLFGSIDDVGWFGLFLRGQLQGISRTVIKQKNGATFCHQVFAHRQG